MKKDFDGFFLRFWNKDKWIKKGLDQLKPKELHLSRFIMEILGDYVRKMNGKDIICELEFRSKVVAKRVRSLYLGAIIFLFAISTFFISSIFFLESIKPLLQNINEFLNFDIIVGLIMLIGILGMIYVFHGEDSFSKEKIKKIVETYNIRLKNIDNLPYNRYTITDTKNGRFYTIPPQKTDINFEIPNNCQLCIILEPRVQNNHLLLIEN
jgi:hypothetical protein